MHSFCRVCQRGGIGQKPAALIRHWQSNPSAMEANADAILNVLKAALDVAWIAEVNPPHNGAERELIATFIALTSAPASAQEVKP